MSFDTANTQDYGAQPSRRGLFSRLRGDNRADAFGSASADDPFAFADDDACFRRRVFGLILVLPLLGVGGGDAAYLHFASPPEKPRPPVKTWQPGGPADATGCPPAPRPSTAPCSPPAPGATNPEPTAAPATSPPRRFQPAPKPMQSVTMLEAPSPRLDREAVSNPVRFADLPWAQAPTQPALAAAPVSDLQRRTRGGLVVPTVGSDRRRPYKVYARPFTGDAKAPKIPVVMAGLGLSQEAACTGDRGDTTRRHSSRRRHRRKLGERMAAARRAGHEALLELGLQSETFPTVDPGPGRLLAVLSPAKNPTRLEQARAAAGVEIAGHAAGGRRSCCRGSATSRSAASSSRRFSPAMVKE